MEGFASERELLRWSNEEGSVTLLGNKQRPGVVDLGEWRNGGRILKEGFLSREW